MAIVHSKWKVVLQLQDSGLVKTSKEIELVDVLDGADQDYAQLLINGNLVVTNFMATTDLSLISWQLSEVFVNDALTTPAAGIRAADQAIVTLRLQSDPTKSATLAIPGAKNGLFMAVSGAGSNDIDPTDTALLALISNFQSPTQIASISDGEAAATANPIIKGKRRNVKNNSG